MRNFKGMEQFIDPEYAARTDHRFQSLGMKMDKGWGEIGKQRNRDQAEIGTRQPWWTLTDMAWIVCLHRGGAIDQEKASTLLTALEQLRDDNSGGSGEDRLGRLLGGHWGQSPSVTRQAF